MSDQTIRAGDLVMIVHSEARNEGKIGTAIRHLGVTSAFAGCTPVCDRWLVNFPNGVYCTDGDLFMQAAIQTRWLRKINPPAISSHTEHKEELPA